VFAVRSGRGSHAEPGEELYQTELYLHHSTGKACLFSDDGEEDNAKWLPSSQLTMTPAKSPRHFIVTMPEWLAKKSKFI